MTVSPSPGNGQSSQTTTTYYNNRLQVSSVLAPDGASTTYEYYPSGELKRTYGARTYPVGYDYDYAGRVRTMTNWSSFSSGAGTRVTTWNYDLYRGWLTNKTYAGGVTGPDYAYTAGGRLLTRTWARIGTQSKRIVTTYTYGFNDGSSGNDHADLVSVAYTRDPQNTPGVTYTLDRRGRRQTAVRNSITTTFTYNGAGEALSESYSGGTLTGLAVTNVYDTMLRRATNSFWNGSTRLGQSVFGYDSASRLHSVGDGTSATATYTYLANSPLVSQIALTQNGTLRMTTIKQYDSLNRLQSISHVSPAQTPLSGFTCWNNDANQRVRVGLPDGSFWLYEYDPLGPVTSGKRYWADGTPVAGQQFEYAHDDIGNRSGTKAGGDENGASLRGATYSANSLNQYTNRTEPGAVDITGVADATATVTVNNQSTYRHGEYYRKELAVTNSATAQWQSVTNKAVESGTTNSVTGNVFLPKTPEYFTYDADGNLLTDGRWNYMWDAENRLLEMGVNTAVGAQKYLRLEYDWQGRRIGKKVWNGASGNGQADVAQKFLSDGGNLIGILNSSFALQTSFTWGLDLSGSPQAAGGVGGLLAINDATNGTHFAAYDGNGNVSALVKASDGTLTAAYEYGPFGELLRTTGPMAKANPFRFSTKYQDDETDLLYYGFRCYNPNTGRWLSRDPISERGGLNLYGILENNCVNDVDMLGAGGLKLPYGPMVNGLQAALDAGDEEEAAIRAWKIYENLYWDSSWTSGKPLAREFLGRWLHKEGGMRILTQAEMQTIMSDAYVRYWIGQRLGTKGLTGSGYRSNLMLEMISASPGTDPFYAMGWFELHFSGNYCVQARKITLDGVFVLKDRYDWQNPGNKSVTVGNIVIYDKWATLVENHQLATPFELRGGISHQGTYDTTKNATVPSNRS